MTARNGDGSAQATSAPTAVVSAAAPAPAPTGCPPGSGTIDIAGLAAPARLLIDGLTSSPSPVTRSTTDLTLRFHVSSSCDGRPVSGALATSPRSRSSSSRSPLRRRPTDRAGRCSHSIRPGASPPRRGSRSSRCSSVHGSRAGTSSEASPLAGSCRSGSRSGDAVLPARPRRSSREARRQRPHTMRPCVRSRSTRTACRGSPTFPSRIRPGSSSMSVPAGSAAPMSKSSARSPARRVRARSSATRSRACSTTARVSPSRTGWPAARASAASPVRESTCEAFRELRIAPGGFAERLRAMTVVPLPDTVGELDGIWIEPLACILRGPDRSSRRPGGGRRLRRGRIALDPAAGCGADARWSQSSRARPSRSRGRARRERDDDPVDAAVLTAPAGVGEALARLSPAGRSLVFAAPDGRAAVLLDAVYRQELSSSARARRPADFDAAIASCRPSSSRRRSNCRSNGSARGSSSIVRRGAEGRLRPVKAARL